MQTKPLLLVLLLFTCFTGFAQVYLEPYTGYQKDLNNKNIQLINTGVQLAFKKKRNELFVQFQKTWLLPYHHNDSAFSLNTSLPLYQPAKKVVHINAMSLGAGSKIQVAGYHSLNGLYLTFNIGIAYQKISVDYDFNKVDYVLLNPDKTQEKVGVYFGTGLLYMRTLNQGRVFAALNISSPPLVGKRDYPYTLNFIAPLSFNIGYSFHLSKK